MTTKRFHLGDVLTVTTGCLVSRDHVGGIYNILNWMTGDNLFTHQLPRAMDECQPHLKAQHPDLADVQVPEFDGDDRDEIKAEVEAWLAAQVARFGEFRDVAPLNAGDHTVIDPLTELAMNHPRLKVIGVRVDDGGAA